MTEILLKKGEISQQLEKGKSSVCTCTEWLQKATIDSKCLMLSVTQTDTVAEVRFPFDSEALHLRSSASYITAFPSILYAFYTFLSCVYILICITLRGKVGMQWLSG